MDGGHFSFSDGDAGPGTTGLALTTVSYTIQVMFIRSDVEVGVGVALINRRETDG